MAGTVRRDVVAAVRTCRLWHGASESALGQLAELASVTEVPRGTLLMAEGDAADRFGLVVAGRVRVLHRTADGRVVTLEVFSSGSVFVAVAALAGGRIPYDVEATTDATIAWLTREALFGVLDSEPALGRAVISDLAERVMNLTSVVQTLSLDVPGRLARYLFQRALAAGEATPEGLLVPLGMSKTDLASSLGTVPETLSRAFARLRDDDLIIVRGTSVVVLDVGALARLGAGYEE